ncbi:MAG: hypothetical protein OEN50_13610, partial [Deltaproteobacteria bacterium]|nr:hypothetical protein [Deltaproteobacteria bacterium]
MSEELSTDRERLQTQIARLLGWEKRKRRETVVAVALFYALLGALFAQPFIASWRSWAWASPIVIFIALASYFFFTRRWRDGDTARALAALDRSLRLDERATTAWELLRHNETKAVALLVLRQAGDKLKILDPRGLFPRIWSWHGYFIAPLLALWLAMLWFDAGFHTNPAKTISPPSLSQTLREFARRLQEKARSEELPKTLKAGQEMEKLAQQRIANNTDDDQFNRELAGMAKKMAAERGTAGQVPFGAAESRQQLEDLRAELEAARDLFNQGAGQGSGQSAQDRLTGLTQLKKQLDQRNRGTQGMNSGEMRSFLDQLDKQVSGELDRRTLLEAEEYLRQLAQRGQGNPGEAQARADGDEEDAAPGDGQRDRNTGVAPGEEPGKNLDKPPSLPGFQGGARAQVKGMIGEGERSGIVFKAKPAPGK